MDKSWMKLERYDGRYLDGIKDFVKFLIEKKPDRRLHKCPCRVCRLRRKKRTLRGMYNHLSKFGMMEDYVVWEEHGESIYTPLVSGFEVQEDDVQMDFAMQIINDAFPFRDDIQEMNPEGTADEVVDDAGDDDRYANDAFEKYQRLLSKAQTPNYTGSNVTVLDAILKAMQLKVDNGWSDKGFDDYLKHTRDLLPVDGNQYPDSYRYVKKILKNLGLEYKIIHACEHGCILYYKEHLERDCCPICRESRYTSDGGSKIPKRVVRYFPLTPRLQRLYMSTRTAREMRWHGERLVTEGELRHPADAETWKNFDIKFPEFSRDFRNVRLALATDGFSPFIGLTSSAHSTWPIMVIPYNLPLSMCMKKDFNILSILILGPKSPGRCLNVFMQPLIDELKLLWDTGVITYDRFSGSSFRMRAAVLSTISDFPGLGMLAGAKTSGYKACPLCLDDIDSTHLTGRMTYQGHRRWLDTNHPWRHAAEKFNGEVELGTPPPSLSGEEVLEKILSHRYSVPSMHPNHVTARRVSSADRVCWTHKTIFYELPYWSSLRQPYSLDVMHIEKNVFDNIIGTILGLEGKSKDDSRAREGLKSQGDRERLLGKSTGSGKEKVSQAPYTVLPAEKKMILEWIQGAKYPYGYAGSIRSKITLKDKKFIGLKTHDCYVILQCLLPVFIHPYLPHSVVEPLIALSTWFKKLCCKEVMVADLRQMKDEIVTILCKLEMIFPPAFFTVMVHLLIHLPEQVLLKGPVNYSWMFPIERQLGGYKKFVRGPRFSEGCIAEQYIAHESVTYCKSYINDYNADIVDHESEKKHYDISVVSEHVKPSRWIRGRKLSKQQIEIAHWCVMEHCVEADHFMNEHLKKYVEEFPYHTNNDRMTNFRPYFYYWMMDLKKQGSEFYMTELEYLARFVLSHTCYSHCQVNGVKFVIWENDQNLQTQNSGVMVDTGVSKYYGVLENVIELKHADGMTVVVFECRWFNTAAGNTKQDHGLQSIDTSTTWFDDTPYCLAVTAKQVFYLDDPKLGDAWKIVNVVQHRGTYSSNSLERDEAYQHVSCDL